MTTFAEVVKGLHVDRNDRFTRGRNARSISILAARLRAGLPVVKRSLWARILRTVRACFARLFKRHGR